MRRGIWAAWLAEAGKDWQRVRAADVEQFAAGQLRDDRLARSLLHGREEDRDRILLQKDSIGLSALEGWSMNRKPNHCIRVCCWLFVGSMGIAANALVNVAQAQSVVGIWECRSLSPTPFGMCQGQTILKPNGTFSRLNRCGTLMAGDEGTYKAGEGYVHYDIKNCWPTEYHGKPMHCLKSETFYFQWVDANTVRGEGSECRRSR